MGLIGILACIIAAVKGRKTFAWIVGIWTALAFVIAFLGASKYAYAPGGLFLAIAIAMKKATNATTSSQQAAAFMEQQDPGKKFRCRACGEYCSGWYQVCPKCGASGQMVKSNSSSPLPVPESSALPETKPEPSVLPETILDPLVLPETKPEPPALQETEQDILAFPETKAEALTSSAIAPENREPQQKSVEQSTESEQKAEPEAKYCRSCGAMLRTNAKFCNSCGTKVEPIKCLLEDISPAPSIEPSRFAEMPQVSFCRKCGTKLIIGETQCQNCGTEISARDSTSMQEKKTAEEETPEILNFDKLLLDRKKMPPFLRRAFLFLEDGDFDRADEYFEKILDQEPECFEAYLGKAMCQNKCNSINDMAEKHMSIKENKDLRRAVQFADGSKKETLYKMLSE